ncbi:hypothetical protein ACWERV_11100 [Streptomyces sp. NPDC004031]
MFHLIRRATVWLARQLFPARDVHRIAVAPSTTARPLRARRPYPYVWNDDGPLLRPYALSDEE